MSAKILQEGFSRPDSLGPVAAVYRMLNEVGLPNGHEPHFHPDTVEICYIIHGHLDWWVGNNSYKVETDDILVMQPMTSHGSVDSTLQPCEYCTIHIDIDKLSPNVAAAIRNPALEGHHPGQPETGKMVMRVLQEHFRQDAFSEEMCHQLCSLIVLSLARGRGAAPVRCFSPLVQRAQKSLLNQDGNTPQVATAAKELGVSSVLLNRRFQEEVGESPGKWIRTQKIAEAKKLLAIEGIGVVTVAARLGFRSSQYFASAFKRETGISPSEYRKKFRAAAAKRRIAFADRAEV